MAELHKQVMRELESAPEVVLEMELRDWILNKQSAIFN